MCDCKGVGTCTCKPDYCPECGYCNICGGYKPGTSGASTPSKVVTCDGCGGSFEIPRKRGRPPKMCPKCRGS